MSGGSLRDQLKALGLVKPKPASVADSPKARPAGRESKSSRPVAQPRIPQGTDAEISLAKAYAAKQAAEQAEAAEQRRLQEEKARLKRERKAAAIRLLAGKCLAKPDAELPRYFEYGKKIRRIYVDADQLQALNTGLLGVAQMDGKFMLVDSATIDELRSLAPEFVALRVEPGTRSTDEDIPADLRW